MNGYVEYNSNNSGGDWCLSDEDWKALEKDGWVVVWAALEHEYTEDGDQVREENGVPKLRDATNSKRPFAAKQDEDGNYRWLGALAREAYLPGCTDVRAAADRWQKVTGKSALDAGCPCCGNPHNFTAYSSDGKWLDSGPDTDYGCSW